MSKAKKKRRPDARTTANEATVEARVRFCRKLIAGGLWTPRTSGKLAERWGVGAHQVRIYGAEARRQLVSADEARDDARLFNDLINEAIDEARGCEFGKDRSRLLLQAAEMVAKRGGLYKPERHVHDIRGADAIFDA